MILLTIIGFVGILLLMLSHSIENWYVTEELGDGFIMLGPYKSLIYRKDNREYDVVPFGVSKYGYDEKWILVYTKDIPMRRNIEDSVVNSENYWIINKKTPIHFNDLDTVVLYLDEHFGTFSYHIITNGLIGPLDSAEFKKIIKKNNIRINMSKCLE